MSKFNGTQLVPMGVCQAEEASNASKIVALWPMYMARDAASFDAMLDQLFAT